MTCAPSGIPSSWGPAPSKLPGERSFQPLEVAIASQLPPIPGPGDGPRPFRRAPPAGAVASGRALWLGACSGGLGAAAALGLQLWSGVPGLLQVIGGGLVVLTPGPVFGWLIDTLQERGRPLLLLGTALLLILIGAAVAAGIAGRGVRRGHQGRVGSGLAAGLALWAVTLPLTAVAQGGLGTTATWSTLLDWLLISVPPQLALASLPDRLVLPARRRDLMGVELTRRRFLELAGALLGAASLGYLGTQVLRSGAPPVLLPAGPEVGRLPAAVTPASDFYVVSKDLFGPPRVDGATWALKVEGTHRLRLSRADLAAFRAVEQVQTLECISNPVGGNLISNGRWRGVPLRALLDRTGVPKGVAEVVFSCADGYTESLPLAQCLQPTTLVATHLDGGELPVQHGFPARILVPGRYGMKNPKWLERISFQAQPYFGYWEQQGWDPAALPRTFSRFDFPGSSSRLPSGRRLLLSGVAWAGERGVALVEVTVDGGRSWRRARLEPPLSPYAWTIWSLAWAPVPGLYSLEVRAADDRGRLQSGTSVGSFPSGAAGRQQLQVVIG